MIEKETKWKQIPQTDNAPRRKPNLRRPPTRSKNTTRKWVAAFCGALIVVIGYFVFEALIYPWIGQWVPFFKVTTYVQAIEEVIPNAIQGTIGAVTGIGLWKTLAGVGQSRPKPSTTTE